MNARVQMHKYTSLFDLQMDCRSCLDKARFVVLDTVIDTKGDLPNNVYYFTKADSNFLHQTNHAECKIGQFCENKIADIW